ncbi:MAG: TM2 domain-containing protein [Ignavibacteriales bacterium]|jgi:TM2 domain.|nr:MAG: TM2 domain-containing protein [Ignavibacteriaceae bacterium]MBW7872893.1 TM2 domain-containing protein [Ignavibacteria bacterium]MCZ2142478.1 TM2 domain-containing protein [Ignavibacteriales bacterium]OQY70875.1 MAG: hypothetical protein B6D45_10760 [Ignavibacteriales bacterium UTCHB3]MBV6445360.1 hypothetical protein [Ignavibacteriaceae bacterium]
MAKIHTYIPGASIEELAFLEKYFEEFTDDQAREFSMLYMSKRKDATTILLLTLLGFFVVAGIQRFMLNDIGMGILYLLTGGLCLIGTIIDLVNYQKMTTDYNLKAAREVLMLMKV